MNNARQPTPPNPQQTAALQTATTKKAGIAQQVMNASDQYGPTGGSLLQTVDPKTGKVVARSSFGATEQPIYDVGAQARLKAAGTGLAQLGDASPMLSKAIDLSDPNIGSTITSRLAPQFQAERERQRLAQDTMLANKGIFQGSDAYTNATREFDANQNDAWDRLSVGARQQIVNEMTGGRDQILKEVSQLGGMGQPIAPNANAVNTPQVTLQPTNVAGITQQGFENQLALAQQKQAQIDAMRAGVFGLAGAGVSAATGGIGGMGLGLLGSVASGGLMTPRSSTFAV